MGQTKSTVEARLIDESKLLRWLVSSISFNVLPLSTLLTLRINHISDLTTYLTHTPSITHQDGPEPGGYGEGVHDHATHQRTDDDEKD